LLSDHKGESWEKTTMINSIFSKLVTVPCLRIKNMSVVTNNNFLLKSHILSWRTLRKGRQAENCWYAWDTPSNSDGSEQLTKSNAN